MTDIVGSGDFKYRVVENWAKLPDGWSFKEVAAVGVDSQDRVYAFNRGEHPIMVFDRDGNFLRSWGEGLWPRAHGIHMGPDDSIYLTDDGAHCFRKCTLDGKILLEIGIPGKPAPYMRASRSTAAPIPRCRRRARSMSPTVMATPGSINIHRTANC
jgi:hypothetical protein